MAFHPDGLTQASAGRNEARLWDVTTGLVVLRLGGAVSSGGSRALAFDKEGRRMVLGGEAGAGLASIALWELEPQRGIQVLRGLASASRKVWFSNNSRRVAALSDHWHLAIWEAATGRLLFNFETPVGALADNAGGCFDAIGSRFAFATGSEACLYDLVTSRVVQRWRLNDGLSDQLQFDGKGRLLLLRRERASDDRRSIWRLYDLTEPESPVLLREQGEADWTAMGMAFRAGGEQFLVWNGGKDANRVIRAFDTAGGRELWSVAADSKLDQLRVFLDPNGRWFGYTEINVPRRLRLMDFSRCEEIGMTANPYEAMSPSGHQFAGAGRFYPDREGKKHAIPFALDWNPNQYIWSFSPDGKLLACGTFEGPVLLADLPEVERRLDLLGRGRR